MNFGARQTRFTSRLCYFIERYNLYLAGASIPQKSNGSKLCFICSICKAVVKMKGACSVFYFFLFQVIGKTG